MLIVFCILAYQRNRILVVFPVSSRKSRIHFFVAFSPLLLFLLLLVVLLLSSVQRLAHCVGNHCVYFDRCLEFSSCCCIKRKSWVRERERTSYAVCLFACNGTPSALSSRFLYLLTNIYANPRTIQSVCTYTFTFAHKLKAMQNRSCILFI